MALELENPTQVEAGVSPRPAGEAAQGRSTGGVSLRHPHPRGHSQGFRELATRVTTILVLILLLGVVVFNTPYDVIGQDSPNVVKRVYKHTAEDGSLALYVFPAVDASRPPTPRPAVVFFHGGGWTGGSVREFYPQSDALSRMGVVAINVEYRVQERHGTTPFESVMDAISAMRWVRAHAKEFNIDPNRIAAAGGSAGGHLAAATATLTAPELDEDAKKEVGFRPNALVLFNPVIDNGPGGYGYERIGERYPDFSPLHNLNADMPATLVMTGDQDHLISVETLEAFRDGMQGLGVRSELIVYPDQKHGFYRIQNSKSDAMYQSTLHDMQTFLHSLGWIN